MSKTDDKKPSSTRPSDIQRTLDPLASVMRAAFMRQRGPGGSEPPAKSSSTKAKGKAPAHPRSPLAPAKFPAMAPVPGVRIGTTQTGLRYKGRPDLLLVQMPAGTSVAGVFTKSSTAAAPVAWCRSCLEAEKTPPKARLLVVNAGNANAFTGKLGLEAVRTVVNQGKSLVGGRQKEIFVASTGVIGQPLKADVLAECMPRALEAAKPDAWKDAAHAIMTTDTYAKGACQTAEIDGDTVTICGIAKGSGMIAPNMATMLAFIFTNANIASQALQAMLLVSVRDSFNAITVDGDTSTNDTVLLFATGEGVAHDQIQRAGDRKLADFRRALDAVMLDLAHQVVKDGEGARKFIEVAVTGASSAKAAEEVARSIANSPLVKTAIAGEDANWGRIVMAVGKADAPVDPDKLTIKLGPVTAVEKGELSPRYDEAAATRHIKGSDVVIAVDLGLGAGAARVWTCDLTHEYIAINGSYRS